MAEQNPLPPIAEAEFIMARNFFDSCFEDWSVAMREAESEPCRNAIIRLSLEANFLRDAAILLSMAAHGLPFSESTLKSLSSDPIRRTAA